MAEPTIVKGSLTNEDIADFTGHRIAVRFTRVVPGEDGRPDAPQVVGEERVNAVASADGTFSVELPPRREWEAPLQFTVTNSAGLGAGLHRIDDTGAVPDIVKIEVAELDDVVVVDVGDDPALGALARFSGRVIDTSGNPAGADLLVVIWGTPPGSDEAFPLAVTETTTGGYFAGPWPSDVLSRAGATVAGSDMVPIVLEAGRLPKQIVVVLEEIPERVGDSPAPPRAPSSEDLARNSAAFSADSDCCEMNFTIPNRTVEEVTFHALVRTTQPAIKGASRPKPVPVPPKFLDRIAELAKMRSQFDRVEAVDRGVAAGDENKIGLARTRLGLADRVMSIDDASDDDGPANGHTGEVVNRIRNMSNVVNVAGSEMTTRVADRASVMLASRDLATQPLRFESSVLAEMAREPGDISPARLLDAERTSLVRRFRFDLDTVADAPIDRFELGSRQVDWDDVPYAYQASTIAHGHILTMKQVWRADGYSLGDLLYSLPLAPGQQKLISILDWDRREDAVRREQRTVTEDTSASLAHDRDISDIIRSSLHESMDGSSQANMSAVGGGIGGFIGPVVFGAAGGVSNASSSARQTSARDVAASSLNRARDKTLQSASSVRGQRSTIVQTARQGESVRAQTEAIANNNHGHALTVEYFEVLRHFQVSQEIAGVQECLFVPFIITAFSERKAYHWRDTLRKGLRLASMAPALDALERVVTNWEEADYPDGRYADEKLRYVDGELWLTMSLPRPADNDDNTFNQANWDPYKDLLGGTSAGDVWQRYMGVALPNQRANIWNTRVAPGIAKRMIEHLNVEMRDTNGVYHPIALDATLVTPFRQNARMLVTFRAEGAVPDLTRAQVNRVRLSFTGVTIPASMDAIVENGSMRYRTDHLNWHFFDDWRIQNDIGATDTVEIITPLESLEKVNPKARDRRTTDELVDHLNEHVEYYHRVIWLNMDANRRYMMLDGVLAPDAGGRSVASVVENQVIGIIGNSLVMPVVPGAKLDPTYEFAEETPEDLLNLYATDPPPAMRISVPTRGVFAEAALGKCNSNEVIDDTRFWRWEEEPIPDSPTAINALSTASRRRTPPSTTPTGFPEALVRMQTAPKAPDPTGLAASLELLGTKDLFKDLTGLAMNQENAGAALKSVMSAAQSFASQGAALAQQKFLNGSMDRGLDLIKKARDAKNISPDQATKLTESLFRGAMGEKRPDTPSVVDNPAVKRSLERVSASENGELKITRPTGTVEVKTGDSVVGAGLDVKVNPELFPVLQPSNMTCWAAGAAMMLSWQTQSSMTIETALDSIGGAWRAKFDANQGLSTLELRAFTRAMGLVEEGPMSYSVEGLARLLRSEGPLWTVSDDLFEGNNIVHVRIVTAVKGDGTVDGTTVTLADSATGTLVTESFRTFANRLEASDPVRFGAGIYHF